MNLRCPDCKHTISEPETEEGKIPEPDDKIVCPECKLATMRMFWIEVPSYSPFDDPPEYHESFS